MTKTKKTICPLDCPDSCGLIATIKDDCVVKLEGDPDHEFTKGFICRKMRRYPQRVESKDRILYPLLRTGDKGSGAFTQISWEEAWQVLVEKLTAIKNKYGGEAVLPFSYAGNMGHVSQTAGNPFFNRFGASRLDDTICSAAAKAGWQAHCGLRPGRDPQEASNAKLTVVWGINIKVTNIHFWSMIQESRRNGGQLVVIDPYKNVTAKAADVYLPVKPGGDTALALGTLKVIIKNNKENRAFIAAKTTGFEVLKTYVMSLSWEKIEADSGITKKQIQMLADLLSANPKTFIRIGIGLTRNTQGAMSVRSIVCLAMVLGLFNNAPGQGVLLSSRSFITNEEKLEYTSLAQKKTRLVNMVQLGYVLTALTPKIHGLFVYNSNPLSVTPDASMVKKGLQREDLFTVVHEQMMTPTARYADLLLPATTMLENRDVYFAYGHFLMGITEPIIKPKGEAIDNFTLFQTLAARMGFTESPFQQKLEDRLQDYLSDIKGLPDEVHISELKPGHYVKSIYADPEKHPLSKVPLTFTSNVIEPTQPAIPCLIPKLEFDDPDLAARYSLKLIIPPNGDLLNSTFGDLYTDHEAEVLIHPQDAKDRGIQTGQMVCLKNHRAKVKRLAKVTEDTQPGLLVAEGIYWENPEKGYNGINELSSQKTTDLGRGGTFHESRVEVFPE